MCVPFASYHIHICNSRLLSIRSEYDFYLFNTHQGGGNVTVTAYVSPSLNGLGDDRPLGLGLQIDDGAPQTSHYVPASVAGGVPSGWSGVDGWVANSIITVPVVLPVQPGAHTLKVWMIEPTVVLQKIVIGACFALECMWFESELT